jgi:pimeloyl-ACP methyl ester carboxylesterase
MVETLKVDSLSKKWTDSLKQRVNHDPEFAVVGKLMHVRFVWELGETRMLFVVERGKIEDIKLDEEITFNDSWQFSLRGSRESWERFLAPCPPPMHNDIWAMVVQVDDVELDGDRLVAMQNIRALSRLMALARLQENNSEAAAGDEERGSARPMTTEETNRPQKNEADIEEIVGRYIHLDLFGQDNRIYFEEAGEGIPLVCLHTAGSDSRQYSHILTDPEMTGQFRVIAFDMPYHGRSNPPDGWWKTQYRLTTSRYATTIIEFCRALALDQPILMGSSMGGAIVLEMAYRYAGEIRAVIGLEATASAKNRFIEYTHHPAVHGGEMTATWTYGLMAPQSPERFRRETWWGYSQGAPGVYQGDTYFYSVDWDASERVSGIDTSRCPVFLLTGEYDFSCTPQDTERTARSIPNAEFELMTGIGHFPMSENPDRFREYLMPALEKIKRRTLTG